LISGTNREPNLLKVQNQTTDKADGAIATDRMAEVTEARTLMARTITTAVDMITAMAVVMETREAQGVAEATTLDTTTTAAAAAETGAAIAEIMVNTVIISLKIISTIKI